MEDGEKIIKGDDELKKYVTEYYCGLFGPSDANLLNLDESRRDDIPQVLVDEKQGLIASFPFEEVREAVFQMEYNKALGPDGFPAEFYQVFWETIKDDLLAMFVDFHNKKLPLHSLNFGIITLLPKKP